MVDCQLFCEKKGVFRGFQRAKPSKTLTIRYRVYKVPVFSHQRCNRIQPRATPWDRNNPKSPKPCRGVRTVKIMKIIRSAVVYSVMKIRDHRGRSSPLQTINGLTPSSAFTKEKRKAITAAFHKAGRKNRRWCIETIVGYFAVVLIPILFALVFVRLFDRALLQGTAPWFGLITGCMVLVVINLIGRRYFQQIFVPVSLEHDCCPSCGYELTGLPLDKEINDGCTICPECGAAWRRVNESDGV